jgi:GDP-D-mannose dehydratase
MPYATGGMRETSSEGCGCGFDKATGTPLVEIDPRYFRPTEASALLGDASKARAKLGWRHKITLTA